MLGLGLGYDLFIMCNSSDAHVASAHAGRSTCLAVKRRSTTADCSPFRRAFMRILSADVRRVDGSLVKFVKLCVTYKTTDRSDDGEDATRHRPVRRSMVVERGVRIPSVWCRRMQ